MSNRDKAECLSEIYRRFHGKTPDAYEEIDGHKHKILVKNCEVRVEEGSKGDSNPLKTALVSCKDNCGAPALVTHGSGEMKEGHFYTVHGVPIIKAAGMMEIISYSEVKNLPTS